MNRACGKYLVLLTFCPVLAAGPAAGEEAEQLAGRILRDSGVQGGLIVTWAAATGN